MILFRNLLEIDKMQLINFGKLVEKAKETDPNVDAAELFGNLCVSLIQQKNAYRGSRALTESEIPRGLENTVKRYFNTHTHGDYNKPFELARLERSNINDAFIYAVPKGIYEELDDDSEFEKGLAEIGKQFGIPIKLPWYCYSK